MIMMNENCSMLTGDGEDREIETMESDEIMIETLVLEGEDETIRAKEFEDVTMVDGEDGEIETMEGEEIVIKTLVLEDEDETNKTKEFEDARIRTMECKDNTMEGQVKIFETSKGEVDIVTLAENNNR